MTSELNKSRQNTVDSRADIKGYSDKCTFPAAHSRVSYTWLN